MFCPPPPLTERSAKSTIFLDVAPKSVRYKSDI